LAKRRRLAPEFSARHCASSRNHFRAAVRRVADEGDAAAASSAQTPLASATSAQGNLAAQHAAHQRVAPAPAPRGAGAALLLKIVTSGSIDTRA